MTTEKKKSTRFGRYLLFYACMMYLIYRYWTLQPAQEAFSFPKLDRGLHSNMDVVGVAAKPTCVSRKAIAALNEFFTPRRIFVVTKSESSCITFKTFAHNVHCLVETQLLPGVSRQSIDKFLTRTYQSYKSGIFKGRDVASWYLQQFLKMGASYYITDLTDYHLVWDLDMILLRNLSIFYRDHDNESLRTIVNIGGLNCPGYDASYKNLTGHNLMKAPDGSSYVTHWMVVYKPHMTGFTNYLASRPRPEYASDEIPWAWSILSSLKAEYLHMGFSEYASYTNWLIRHHSQSIHVMKKKTWSRYPIGGALGMSLLAYWSQNKLCCPHTITINTMKNRNYQYFGVELGHSTACRYNDPEFEDRYGV